MKAAGTPQSLPKHCLQNKNSNLLTAEDLQRLVEHLNLPQPDSGAPAEMQEAKCTSLISVLAKHFCLNVADCLARFQEREETANCLLHDPFAEAIYLDLDHDDKLEFADFGMTLKKKKIRKAQQALGQSRKFMRNVRGRGRGHGQSSRGRGRVPQGQPSGPGGNEPQQVAPVGAAATAEPSMPGGNDPQQGAPVAAAATAEPSTPGGGNEPQQAAPVGAAELEEPRAAAPGQAHPRRANTLDHILEWQKEICTRCGRVAGEYKYHPSPGLRDAPSWTMRCVEDHTQKMGTYAPYKKRVL